ncbi:MAG: ubiquitin-like domain-containing protein [Promethearchaeota archaeon]
MSFKDEFDEDLVDEEPVRSKTPATKTPSAGKKLTLYFMSTIGPGEKKEKLTVIDDNRVKEIKHTLGNLFGLNPNDFHISSGGVTMDDEDQLKDCSIRNGDDILLIPASTAGINFYPIYIFFIFIFLGN